MSKKAKKISIDYLEEVQRHHYPKRLDESKFLYIEMLTSITGKIKLSDESGLARGNRIAALQRISDHIKKLRSSECPHDREIGRQLKLERDYIRQREKEDLKLAIQMTFSNTFINDIYTLDECGKVLGVSRERARQLETQASKLLKHPKVAQRLKKYNEE